MLTQYEYLEGDVSDTVSLVHVQSAEQCMSGFEVMLQESVQIHELEILYIKMYLLLTKYRYFQPWTSPSPVLYYGSGKQFGIAVFYFSAYIA